MSEALNKQAPSAAQPKLTASQASDIKHRDIAMFVLLMFVTLGIYWFYLCFCWAKELNGLHGRLKYQPWLVMLANVVTCGIAGIVFEVLFASDIGQATRARGVADRMEQLPAFVIGLNVAAIVTSATAVGIIVALPLGILASVFVQIELNKLALIYSE